MLCGHDRVAVNSAFLCCVLCYPSPSLATISKSVTGSSSDADDRRGLRGVDGTANDDDDANDAAAVAISGRGAATRDGLGKDGTDAQR